MSQLLKKRSTELELEEKNTLLEKQLSEKQIELLQAGAQIQSMQSPEESSPRAVRNAALEEQIIQLGEHFLHFIFKFPLIYGEGT